MGRQEEMKEGKGRELKEGDRRRDGKERGLETRREDGHLVA